MLPSSRIPGSSNGSPAESGITGLAGSGTGCSMEQPAAGDMLIMYFVYILESVSTGRWYIGSTQDVVSRLELHNLGRVRSSKPYLPYKVVYTETHETRGDAMQREQAIKRSGAIRKGIKRELAVRQSGIV